MVKIILINIKYKKFLYKISPSIKKNRVKLIVKNWRVIISIHKEVNQFGFTFFNLI